MNTNIILVETVTEAQQILSNARDAVLSGEIDQKQYQEILDSCYHTYLDALVTTRKEQS